MRKLIILACIIISLFFVIYSVKAYPIVLTESFTLSPTAVYSSTVNFSKVVDYYVFTLEITWYKSNITIAKTLPYYYYGNAYFTDNPISSGNVSVEVTKEYYSDLNLLIAEMNNYYNIPYEYYGSYNSYMIGYNISSYLGSNWEHFTDKSITAGNFNFVLRTMENDNSTYLYEGYILTWIDYSAMLYGRQFMIVKYIPTNSVPSAIITGEGAETNLPLLTILIFVPAMISGALFTKYDIGLIGFLVGMNISTGITYMILFVPVWFIYALVIIDVIIIILIVHQRGVF
jgi:hypothetical protein